MPFKVYISHSVSPRELAAVYSVAEQSSRLGMEAFVPDRLWSPHEPLPARILPYLRDAESIVLFATLSGSHIDWVNRELREGSPGKQSFAVVDRGISISGFPEERLVYIDRSNLSVTVSQVASKLADLKLEKEHREALGWLALGSILFFLFLAAPKGK